MNTILATVLIVMCVFHVAANAASLWWVIRGKNKECDALADYSDALPLRFKDRAMALAFVDGFNKTEKHHGYQAAWNWQRECVAYVVPEWDRLDWDGLHDMEAFPADVMLANLSRTISPEAPDETK